jgi:hypothetical protein
MVGRFIFPIGMNMKSGKVAFQNSLLCLQHPITILSIIILIINDHVLKTYYSSWLTGKLSDFAGLFFFPFLLTIVLSLIFWKSKVTLHQIGYSAFGLIFISFVLLKTVPFANIFVEKTISSILNHQVRFVLDPTDLLGFLMLWPAWRLWDRPKKIQPSRLVASVVFSFAVLASIATSPRELTVYSVTDLSFSDDGAIYAADKANDGTSWFPVAVSRDGGLTWELSYDDNDMLKIDKKSFPIEDCKYLAYFEFTDCYRVTSKLEFEYTFFYPDDASYSWSPVFPSKGLSVNAYDMIVITQDGKQVIIVAIGEAGILRRILPDGNWDIIDVLGAGSNDSFSHGPY